MRRLVSILATAALLVSGMAAVPAATLAAAPPAPYFNGFEDAGDAITGVTTDTQAMFDVTRVASPTGSISAAAGGWFAEAAQNLMDVSGNTPLNQFTRYGGYSSTFPAGGYTTSIDIYLDMSSATGTNDVRFDWSSAISDSSGNHRRDFIFNAGTSPTTANQFVISASNNAPGWPSGGINPLTISTSGWYTFEHRFYDAGAGVLAVDMSVLDAGHNVLRTWTRSDPSDIIGSTVGGNRYGWLVDNGFSTLALDNITRSGVLPKCTATGFFRDRINLTAAQIGGTVTGILDATTCNIGAYFDATHPGSVTGATIFGANYYGVVVNAAAVNVTNSTIRDIGETPLNGSQHGVGVLYTTIDQAKVPTGTSATGTLSGTTITNYQKNGVVISGTGAAVTVDNNTVTGQGPVDYIAQNGIQVSYGSSALVTRNTVTNNYYTPKAWTACGLLFYQAGGVKQSKNVFSGNETNVCNAGRGGGQFSE